MLIMHSHLKVHILIFVILAFCLSSYFCSTIVSKPISDVFLKKDDLQYKTTLPFSTFSSTKGSIVKLSAHVKPPWIYDDVTDLEEVGGFVTTGYSASSSVYHENFVYLSLDSYPRTGAGFMVFNVTDRINPVLVGGLNYIDKSLYTIGVYYQDNYAFMVSRKYLFIINTTDKTYPQIVAKLDGLTTNMFGLFVEGDYAYTAGDSGVFIIDISKKDAPFVVVEILLSGSRFVYVRDNHALVLYNGYNGIQIYDLSNKAFPVLINSVDIDIGSQLTAWRGCVENNYMYLSFSDDDIHDIGIIDIHNITTPIFMSAVKNVSVGYYSHDGITEKDGYIYHVNHSPTSDLSDGLVIIDVRNKSSPVEISTLKSIGDSQTVCVTEAGFAYVFENENNRMVVVNVSDKYSPVFVSGQSYAGKYSTDRQNVFVDGKYAYIVNYHQQPSDIKLKVFDVSNKNSPVLVAAHNQVTIPLQNYEFAFFAVGDFVYICFYTSFQIFDFHEKSRPVLIGNLNLPERARKIFVRGNFSYLVGSGPIYIVDVSDKEAPVLIGSFYDDEKVNPYSFLEGDYIYSAKYKKFTIFSIVNASNISEVGSYDFSGSLGTGSLKGVFIRGNFGYLISNYGFFVMDVTTKTNPILVGSGEREYYESIFVQDDFAYVADGDVVQVFDISNKSNPFITNTISKCSGEADDVFAYNNHAYVTYRDVGFDIYEIGNLKLVGTVPSYTSLCEKIEITIEGSDDDDSSYVSYSLYFHDGKVGTEECGGNGQCNKDGICECNEHFSSSYTNGPCTEWLCGSFKFYEQNACSGNGECIGPGECRCKSGFSGSLCETDIVLIVLAVVLPTISVIVLSDVGVCCLVCFSILCIICCCLVSIFPLIYLLRLSFSQRLGLTKYRQLKDFDILLQEQLLDDNNTSETARFKIKKDVFKIPFEEVKIIEAIGEGGSQALVFKSIWQDRIVAFKCFKTRHVLATENDFQEFEREVSVIASISHPNIVRFFGCSLKPPRVGIVMEYCDKGEILDFFQNWKSNHENINYSPSEKFRMISEIVSAMTYLHSRSIIHRDIKCENILVDENESIRLMDFGLSRFIEKTGKRFLTSKVGTNIYMPPEIASGLPYDERCDVFSFGITVYVIFTEDTHPYGEEDFNIQYRVAKNHDLRPPVEKLEEILSSEYYWIIDILKKCWKHDFSDRPSFQDIQEKFDSDKR